MKPPSGKRFPPLLFLSLVVIWLLLNQTLALGYVVLGAVLAAALCWLAADLRPLQPRIRRPWLALVVAVLVLIDIVRSNIGVFRIVLGLVRDREVKSGFVRIPLDMRDPHGIAVLSTIVTSTPGTVWVALAPDGRFVTLHVLDLRDEEEWIRWIKDRYERHLMRIFE